MVPGSPVRSEQSLQRRFDPAPGFQPGPRSRVALEPKIPHAGQGWSRALCRRHLSRTFSLDRHLCIRERPGERDVRLAHGNPHALDERKLQCALRDSLPDFLEKADMTVRHYIGDKVVDAPVIDDVLCGQLRATSSNPERRIDLDRLRYLRLMRQHSYARVKTHGLEGDNV